MVVMPEAGRGCIQPVDDLLNRDYAAGLVGACFDLRTGKVTAPPVYEDVTTYATRVLDGRVQVWEEHSG